jgi:hypothetical protein
MSLYVPDYYEVTLPGIEHRAFLLVVRLRDADEDPAKLWEGFAGRRRSLNAELRAEYDELAAEDEEELDPISGPSRPGERREREPEGDGDPDAEEAFGAAG